MSLQDISVNLEIVQKRIDQACRKAGRIPEEVTLIAVTKNVEPTAIETAYLLGVRNFGENRVQEAENKITQLSHLQPRPSWHMIGHLQSNKVKTALNLFNTIQSVDSVSLAEAIDHRSNRKIPILLEVNVAAESTKSGFFQDELKRAYEVILKLNQIEVTGLMTVAPLLEDTQTVRPVFSRLRELRDSLGLKHLSMGMTDDFEVAIEEGATMVRIGRGIFGERSVL